MKRIPGIRRFFRIDRGRAVVERAVDDELQFHFDMTMRDLMAQGMTPGDARNEAERRFGDVERARRALAAIDKQRVASETRSEWWSAAAQDVRYALRGMRLKPGFTMAVVLTLALGVGATATMYGIIDRLLFRPPAFLVAPERVHRLYYVRTYDGKENFNSWIQYKRYTDMAQWSKSFEIFGGYTAWKIAMGIGDGAKEQNVGMMTATLWRFFDAKPVIGRFFAPEEDKAPDGARVAVLSEGYWRSEYGARTDVLGKKINIGPSIYTVIGVAPRGFAAMSLETPVAFIPLTAAGADMSLDSNKPADYHTTYNMSWFETFGRAKPGVTLEAATADLTNAFRQSYLAELVLRPKATPIAILKPHAIAGPVQSDGGPNQTESVKVAKWLVGVALIVLLIACANVGNLLLARALRRRREIAVRMALGISRARLFAQLLSESILLALLGGVAGLLVAQWGGKVLRDMLLSSVEWTSTIADSRVLLFAALATLAAGLLSGVAPIIQTRGADVAAALKSGVREGAIHRSRLRVGLLLMQAGLSVVLLIGAGLFVRSLVNVQHIDFGYDVDRLLWVDPRLRSTKLSKDEQTILKRHLVDRAATIPGVEHAARGVTVPFWMTWTDDLFVQGIDSVSKLGEFTLQAVSPGFFETTGTSILRGRPITADDRPGAPRAMVVSDAMAKKLWPRQDAIGKCVRVEADTMPCTYVVGIAKNIKRGSLKDDPGLHYYMAIDQFRPAQGGMYVRTRGNAADHAETIRRELQRDMPGDSYINVTAMSEILAPNTRSWKLGATMFTIFGGLALLLAAIGLYSVIAYNVTQRTHEMGVRVALGAQSRDVVSLIVKDGLRITLAGIALGVLVAMGAGRWLAPLLFNVSPKDSTVFGSVILTLVLVAIAASWWPALRASRVDPNVALRAD